MLHVPYALTRETAEPGGLSSMGSVVLVSALTSLPVQLWQVFHVYFVDERILLKCLIVDYILCQMFERT